MKTHSISLYSLSFQQAKTYQVALAFVAGNILLPQLCHLVPQGGLTLLPIYFFTIVAAYKFGWKAGLLTAILSPLANNLLFGMPATAILPIILVKSTLAAFAAGFAAQYFKKNSLLVLALVVAAYQVVGTLVEWAMVGDLFVALQDFRIGMPGMLLQVFGVYLFIKHLIAK